MTITVVKPGVIPVPLQVEWFGECSHCGCQMISDEFPATSPPCPPSPPPCRDVPYTKSTYDGKEQFSTPCQTCGRDTTMIRRIVAKAPSGPVKRPCH